MTLLNYQYTIKSIERLYSICNTRRNIKEMQNNKLKQNVKASNKLSKSDKEFVRVLFVSFCCAGLSYSFIIGICHILVYLDKFH